MGGEKMAKSTGNIARVADLLEAGVSPRALRYVLSAVHYRQGLDYSDTALEAAGAALERLDTLLTALDSYAEARADDRTLPHLLDRTRSAFEAAFDDDLNVSAALAAIFELVREANRRLAARSISTVDAARIVQLLRDLDRVLGILPAAEDEALEPDLASLLEARVAARAAREWARSDRLRAELAERGVIVEDTRDGQRWRRLEVAR
jgi:cysteinyl-tRNA synthetase